MREDKNFIGKITNIIVDVFLLGLIIVLLFYIGVELLNLSTSILDHQVRKIVHDVAYFIVLLKAYKVLFSYFMKGNISIRYIIEISIIAPAIEVVFAFDKHDIATNIFLGTFCLLSMLIYAYIYKDIMISQEK